VKKSAKTSKVSLKGWLTALDKILETYSALVSKWHWQAVLPLLMLHIRFDVLREISDVWYFGEKLYVDWVVVLVFHISYSFSLKRSYIIFKFFLQFLTLMCGYRSRKLKSEETPFATLGRIFYVTQWPTSPFAVAYCIYRNEKIGHAYDTSIGGSRIFFGGSSRMSSSGCILTVWTQLLR